MRYRHALYPSSLIVLALACQSTPAPTSSTTAAKEAPAKSTNEPSDAVPRAKIEVVEPEPIEGSAPGDRLAFSEPRDIFFHHGDQPFAVPQGLDPDIIGLATADMDGDGDPDLIINRHLRHPIELWENVGGKFQLRNPAENDTSGIFDNPRVPDLFMAYPEQPFDDCADCEAGLYVWHDASRDCRMWTLAYYVPEDAKASAIDPLTVRVSVPTPGLGPVEPPAGDCMRCGANKPLCWTDEASAEEAEKLELELAPGESTHLRGPAISTRLQVDVDGAALFLGRSRTKVASGASPWLQDHHGVTWLDLFADAKPELFVSRGANQGTLHPPNPGKRDSLFATTAADADLLYEEIVGAIEDNYCSARQVAWADVLGQGGPGMLTIACEGQPNMVLSLEQDPVKLVDRAGDLGLRGCSEWDSDAGERDARCMYLAFAWTDLDGYGQLELIRTTQPGEFAAGTEPDKGLRLEVLRRRGGRFEIDKVVGLDKLLRPGQIEKLCKGFAGAVHCSVVPPILQLVDMDRDGDLDLWLSGYGLVGLDADGKPTAGAFDTAHAMLLLRTGKRFKAEERPQSWPEQGLNKYDWGVDNLVAADLDNDGFPELITGKLGVSQLVIHANPGKADVDPDAYPVELTSVPSLHTAVLDIDGDGRLDLVGTGQVDCPQRDGTTETEDCPDGACAGTPPPSCTKNLATFNVGANVGAALVADIDAPPGSLVRAYYSGESVLVQQIGATHSSRYSQGQLPMVFGDAKAITKLTVQFPGSTEQIELEIPSN